jgi:hypothetical protein
VTRARPALLLLRRPTKADASAKRPRAAGLAVPPHSPMRGSETDTRSAAAARRESIFKSQASCWEAPKFGRVKSPQFEEAHGRFLLEALARRGRGGSGSRGRDNIVAQCWCMAPCTWPVVLVMVAVCLLECCCRAAGWCLLPGCYRGATMLMGAADQPPSFRGSVHVITLRL